jgi:bifunctional non-homologous end joining protein LigD
MELSGLRLLDKLRPFEVLAANDWIAPRTFVMTASTAAAFAKLPVKMAYIDGELCGVRADGVTSFELMQQSSDAGYGGLVHFAFDLLELDGENVASLSLLDRKERLAQLLQNPPAGIVYSDHEAATARRFAVRRVNLDLRASSPSDSAERQGYQGRGPWLAGFPHIIGSPARLGATNRAQ